jgi:predicted RNA binding protein YcfA (HicA-like mRNA interferase family)
VKSKQFIARLRRAGVVIDKARGKGGHRWATYKGRSTTIPVHGDADMGPVFMKKICKQLGLDPKKVL